MEDLINPVTPYWAFKGQTLEWLPSDSQELYKHNLKNHLQELKQHGWLDQKINYQFNQQGFRSDEFGGRPGLMFLGCSYTLGVGIHQTQSWPWLVAKARGLQCWNLGIGGGSNDTAMRLATYWVPKLRPQAVIYTETMAQRMEVLHHGEDVCLIPNIGACPAAIHKYYFDVWLTDDTNAEINRKKNLWAIKWLCHQSSIPLVTLSIYQMPNQDLGRDLLHPGPISNAEFAAMALNEVKTLLEA